VAHVANTRNEATASCSNRPLAQPRIKYCLRFCLCQPPSPLPSSPISPMSLAATLTPSQSVVPPQSPTLVHSHPLLSDDSPVGTRRRTPRSTPHRQEQTTSGGEPAPSYFARRNRLEIESHAGSRQTTANWDGSVRGHGARARVHNGANTVAEISPRSRKALNAIWDEQPTLAPAATPVFVVGPARGTQADAADLVTAIADGSAEPIAKETVSHILTTRWHKYSDEAIQAAIALSADADSPASGASHPYHTALRVLSAATHRLGQARREIEESRRVLAEKEEARKERAHALVKELAPSERDVARRVLASLFTDDDEDLHRIERKQSHIVRASTSFRVVSRPNAAGLVAI
jgi:hypothetical protein